MTLANMLRRKLSETPAADERHELAVADEASGWSVYLSAERHDKWTTVAWEMTVRRIQASGKLADWAARVAEKTSGLMETLRVVEIDAAHDRALIRSAAPSDTDSALAYYEVVLQGTKSALVRRYEGSHTSGKRTQVPFVLTNEVLAKFAGDIASE